jgi:hypothetical protein
MLTKIYNNQALTVNIVRANEYNEVVSGVSGVISSFVLNTSINFKAQILRDGEGKQIQSVGYVDFSPGDVPSGVDLFSLIENIYITYATRKYGVAGYDIKDSYGSIVTYRVFLR